MEGAFIYARCSRTSGYHEQSIARQEKICTDYLINNNKKPLGLFADVAVSSETPLKERPQFKTLLANLNKQTQNIIIIEEISRLLRTLEIAEEFKQIMLEYNITLISTNNPKIMTYLNNLTLLEPLLEHLINQKKTLVQKLKLIEKFAHSVSERSTLTGASKVGGRKSWIEKDPRVLKIVQQNRDCTIKEIQKKLLDENIVSKNNKVISSNTIFKIKKLVLGSPVNPFFKAPGKRSYSTGLPKDPTINNNSGNSNISNNKEDFSIRLDLEDLNLGQDLNSCSEGSYNNSPKQDIKSKAKDLISLSDPCNIAKLVAKLGSFFNKLLYCESEDQWYYYNLETGIWNTLTIQKVAFLIREVIGKTFEKGGFRVKKQLSFAFLKEISIFLQAVEGLTIKDWPNTSKQYIPLQDKLWDLSTNSILEKNPAFYIRWAILIDSNKVLEAKPSDFYNTNLYSWFKEITGGKYDLIYLLLAFLKLCITRTTRFHKFLEIVGPGGTGKSTLIKLFTAIVGKHNTAVTELKQLEQNRFETANLFNKSLVTITDSARYSGDCSILKAIVGEDPLRLEEKHKQIKGAFKVEGLVLIASNEEIRTTDYTSGLARRRLSLFFNKKPKVPKLLINETDSGWEGEFVPELPLLFKYIVSLDNQVISSCFNFPEKYLPSLIEGKFSMERTTNPIISFILDRCMLNPLSYLPVGTKDDVISLYSAYYHYCISQSICPVSSSRFISLFFDIVNNQLKLPVTKSRASIGVVVQGLSLISGDFNWEIFFNSTSNMPHLFSLVPCLTINPNINSSAPVLYNSLEEVEDKIRSGHFALDNPSLSASDLMSVNAIAYRREYYEMKILNIKSYRMLSSLNAYFNIGHADLNGYHLAPGLIFEKKILNTQTTDLFNYDTALIFRAKVIEEHVNLQTGKSNN